MRTITRGELRIMLEEVWLRGYDEGVDDWIFRGSPSGKSKRERLRQDCDDLLNAHLPPLEADSPVEVQGVGADEISAPAASHALPEGSGR